MKINFSLSKLIENNRFIQILSVIIAIIAWLFVSITIDDNQIARIDNVPLTIDLANTTPETLKLSLIDGADQTVSVKVEGVRYQVGNLTPDDFVATPVLSSVNKTGEQDVKVEVRKKDTTNNSFKIVNYTQTVKMTFDRLSEKTFELNPVASNVQAAEGFREDQLTATPKELTLTGPQSELERIAKINVEYDGTETASDTLIVDGKLVFYDAENKKISDSQISHVTYDNQVFSVTIPIYMQKTVPIKVSFINAEGIDTSKLKYDLTMDTITIAGPRDIIDSRQDVTIGPIDFSKLDLDAAFTFEIPLDAGIVNEDGINEVTVYVDTSEMDRKSLSVEKGNILLKNIPADYQVTIENDSIKNVKMVGGRTDIQNLSSKELLAWADLQNIKEGTSRVRVSIYTTGNKFAWAVGEYSVTLKAVKK